MAEQSCVRKIPSRSVRERKLFRCNGTPFSGKRGDMYTRINVNPIRALLCAARRYTPQKRATGTNSGAINGRIQFPRDRQKRRITNSNPRHVCQIRWNSFRANPPVKCRARCLQTIAIPTKMNSRPQKQGGIVKKFHARSNHIFLKLIIFIKMPYYSPPDQIQNHSGKYKKRYYIKKDMCV